MSKLFFILIPLLIILIVGTFFYSFYKFSQPTAEIKGHKFQLLIAKSDKDKQIGLSKYNNLAKDKGMVFIFDNEGLYSFWMKDMKFPIDILFIKGDKIVTIQQNVPINNLTIYSPTQNVDKVLEINANLSREYGINVGDSVTLKNVK